MKSQDAAQGPSEVLIASFSGEKKILATGYWLVMDDYGLGLK